MAVYNGNLRVWDRPGNTYLTGLANYTMANATMHTGYLINDNSGYDFGSGLLLRNNQTVVSFRDGSIANSPPIPSSLVFTCTKLNSNLTDHTDYDYMTILADGNVGIGENFATPVTLLHLHKNASKNSITITSNMTAGTTIDDGIEIGINSSKNGFINNKEEGGIEFLTNDVTSTKNSRKVLIDVNGKVLIDPNYNLIGTYNQANFTRTLLNLHIEDYDHHVYQNFTNKTTVSNDQDGLRLGLDANKNAIINMQEDADLIFYTNGASATAQYLNSNERMRITNAGLVGIGTNAPAFELDIVGSINVTGAGFSGSGGTWGISDRRLKENINDISSALTLIKRLNGKTYNFKSEIPICRNTNGLFSGFIAQELQEVIPLAVKERKDGYLAVNYDAIIPYIVEAIKEQDQKIEAISSPQNTSLYQIENLQQQLDSLKKIVLELSLDKANVSKDIKQLKQELTLNDEPKLLQNQPNPFSSSTIIYYYLPVSTGNSYIKVFDANGKLINSYKLTNTGYAHLEVKAGDIAQGTFTYILEVNNKQVDSKKMILAKD